jgi:hypothetical protein
VTTDLTALALADFERRIREHQEAITELRESAARLEEFARLSGSEALAWLTSRGCSDAEARGLVVAVVRERRAQRARLAGGTEG